MEAKMTERIFDVYWEGPYEWKDYKGKINGSHVLYALFGTHPVHGHNSLLYIGKTEEIRTRFAAHEEWVEEEYDAVTIRVASMGEIFSWEGWDVGNQYPRDKITSEDISGVEALLIFSHHPGYNQRSKYSMDSAKNIRIFNTGKIGKLLPEVSYRYHNEKGEW
jgi:hypothetical protein